MPPVLAALLTLGFIGFLFRRDCREQANVTRALWLPVAWMLIITSRHVSQWLNLWGFSVGDISLEEGSPIDAALFFALIVGGVYVLKKRHASVSGIARNNFWLTAFLLYCFLAIFWSDFPFVSLKRWIKTLGHPIMALILFTEPDPEEAIARLMKRCAFVLIPVSILFIKYYPEWGRGFDSWTGAGVNTGITTDKNALGHDCMILGFFFAWQFLRLKWRDASKDQRHDLLLSVCFLAMIGWLLKMAHCSTALVALLVGLVILVFVGLPFVNKRFVERYLLATILIGVVAEVTLGASTQIILLLGKNPTLTDRTLLWSDVLKVEINPLLGAGFEGFWLGPRLQKLWQIHWWQPNQAHNGYIETYLNLGLCGLFLLLGLIIATFRKICQELPRNFEFSRFRLGFLIAVVLYNWTESSFKATHPVWFAFYIIAIDYPRLQVAYAAGAYAPELLTSDPEFACGEQKPLSQTDKGRGDDCPIKGQYRPELHRTSPVELLSCG